VNVSRLLEQIRFLNEDIAPKSQKPSVGVIFDNSSASQNDPIALIIGINYGQNKSSGSSIQKLQDDPQDDIKYARHISRIAKVNKLENKNYSVVLWNFYPHLTEAEWTEDVSNSEDEAKRIFEGGYADVFGTFEKVCNKLQPKLIVFHGISSAVPILARVALKRINHRLVFIAPNLSRGLCESKTERIQM
jgi:hypothetical protein